MRCGAILGSPLRPPGRHLPVWVRRVSQFRLVAFTAFQTRVPLVSIDCKGSAISPFWLEDFAHCPQASYPRLCRDLTHAAYPSHHYSYAALSEQHQLPLKGALGGPAKTPILNFGNQAYKHRARFSPERLAARMLVMPLVRAVAVGAPGLGHARRVLHRDALPARRERAIKPGVGVLVRLHRGAEGGNILLAEVQVLTGQCVKLRQLARVGVQEPDMRDGAGQFHREYT